MAEKIEKFERFAGSSAPKYPWPEWQVGAWEVTGGIDFTSTPANFVILLHRKAKHLGRKVRTSRSGDRVVFEFYDD